MIDSHTEVEPAPEYPGYHYEWVVDEGWRIGGDGRKCRMPRCQNPAVAAFRRKHRGRDINDNFRWWRYCASHLYGRKIEDGVVKSRRLVEDRAEEEEL